MPPLRVACLREGGRHAEHAEGKAARGPPGVACRAPGPSPPACASPRLQEAPAHRVPSRSRPRADPSSESPGAGGSAGAPHLAGSALLRAPPAPAPAPPRWSEGAAPAGRTRVRPSWLPGPRGLGGRAGGAGRVLGPGAPCAETPRAQGPEAAEPGNRRRVRPGAQRSGRPGLMSPAWGCGRLRCAAAELGPRAGARGLSVRSGPQMTNPPGWLGRVPRFPRSPPASAPDALLSAAGKGRKSRSGGGVLFGALSSGRGWRGLVQVPEPERGDLKRKTV